jgi:hypothetical protein
MQSKASTVEEYLNELPEDRIAAMLQLQKTIKKNLPKGFSEEMNYGMLGYVVPHKLYPAGYHCDPKLPLPFLAIASQKNFIAVYHMGIYADPELHDWFINAYAALNIGKLDMGKSCIRFKNPAKIPFDLIGQLVSKMSPQQWIAMYESNYKK